MKTLIKILALGLTLGATSNLLQAQDARPGDDGPPPPRRPVDAPRGPEGRHMRPPVGPLFAALDLNHDGVIDAEEMAKASESLKKLDRNGDGRLTPREIRPRHLRRASRAGGPPEDRAGHRPEVPDGSGAGDQFAPPPPLAGDN